MPTSRSPAQVWEVFLTRVAELGGHPTAGAVYVNNSTPVPLNCAAGHSCAPTPAHVLAGRGLCGICARNNRAAAEAAFWVRVEELGGQPAPDAAYVNNRTPVALICEAGHPCMPTPTNVTRGSGLCRTCAGQDPEVSEAAFWTRVRERGARPAAGAVYRNALTPVPLICAEGHACAPTPNDLQQGHGFCRTCAGLNPAVAEAAFWARVRELGGRRALGAAYVNAQTPVRLICAAGHPCAPRPTSVQRGNGICRTCAGLDAEATEAAFWARVRDLGGRRAPEGGYVNAVTPVPLICSAGHACAPWPNNVLRGGGLCRSCAGTDPRVAEVAFWARVAELGGRPAPGAVYVNSGTPVELICAEGHACAPHPTSLQRGQGLCHQCSRSFDRVYLLVHTVAGAVKVGVATSPTRVRGHVRRGYSLMAEWTGLEHSDAVAAERAVLAYWEAAGAPPVLTAPADGWTETAPATMLHSTYAQLVGLLGAPRSAP